MRPINSAERKAAPCLLDDNNFWAELRGRILPLKPSQYDLTSRCNLTCEGCLFFSGSDYLAHADEDNPEQVDQFFRSEADRGVRYGYFGGAEPSLVEHKLIKAAQHVPFGVVFTNGTRRLTAEIPYRVHVSVWGRPDRSRQVRGAEMLDKQTRNYLGDERAVFVYTISQQNIDDLPWIADYCADRGLKLSLNHYSPTAKYASYLEGGLLEDAYHARSNGDDNLILKADQLTRCRDVVSGLLDLYPQTILYSEEMNASMHDPIGLYPDLDPGTGIARDCGVRLTNSLRHYNTDLSASRGKCCTPNVSCSTCRLYAQSYATLLVRATRDARRSHRAAQTIRLWRLWCALFLNDDRLAVWPARVAADACVDGSVSLPT